MFDSLTHEKQIYQDVVQILIYTGQRKGNVYSMECEELDLERGVWTIPHTKTDLNQSVLQNIFQKFLTGSIILKTGLTMIYWILLKPPLNLAIKL